MKLEKQVANLELSKKIKELNVPQTSLFSWVEPNRDKDSDYVERDGYFDNTYWIASAFTSAELGEILPENIDTHRFEGKWNCRVYKDDYCTLLVYSLWADSEADAKAKMLIYLIEQSLMTKE